MIKLKYGNIMLDIYNEYQITKSSQEVTFNDLTCDFTNRTVEELPEKYQEAKLIDIDNLGNEKILFFGYIENYDFGEMRETEVERDINITLLSPMKLATLRTVVLTGTYELKDLIKEVLQPLLDDGYEIKEIQITNRRVTINYPLSTVEYCMNNLSNKFNFWWFIDEQKRIYIKDISLMLSKKPDYKYDKNNTIPYLQYVKPKVNSEGYANVVNFKNVRIYENSYIFFQGKSITSYKNQLLDGQLNNELKKGEQINFNFPCDIKKENIIKSAKSNGTDDIWQYPILYGLRIMGAYSNGNSFEVYIRYDQKTKIYSISSNIGFDDKEIDKEKDFLLIRDNFFSNLITGIKFNNETTNIKTITEIKSDSILVKNISRMYNDSAIYEKKGIISNTGIVEITVDMNESWKTLEELREIGVTYMDKNSLKLDGELELKVDTVCNIEIGNTIEINKMLFSGTYIVTKIQQNFKNNENEWIIVCKNGNMLSNFIDIFRRENSQEAEETEYKVSITHYIEDKIKEVFEVIK